ncbi:MAG: glycosyltransferase [Pseudomonadota bacterium]|nr:glycosyltransferase [Pseudomonadota bacterium]
MIIPTLNEERMIGACLQALVAQDLARERISVVVVDNGSTDGTLGVIDTFREQLAVRVFQRPGLRISGLRNFGVAQVDTPVIAFLDADCLPEPDWAARALVALDTLGPRIILGGDYRIPPASSWLARAWFEQRSAPKSGSVGYLPSGNLLMRRAEFLALGGFDESLQTNEDAELCARARGTGFSVHADPQLAVVHLGTPQTIAQFFRKQRWHGSHVFRVFLRSRGRQNLKPVALAFTTIIAGGALPVTLAYAASGGRLEPASIAAALLLGPPLTLASRSILRHGRVRYFLPIAAAVLLYGVARAASILQSGRSSRG